MRGENSIFDELQTSLQEAVEIKQGKAQASRITRHEVADVKALRAKLNVSQTEFAEAMGTSVDTIKSLETKRRNPTGLAAKVLATIRNNPAFLASWLRISISTSAHLSPDHLKEAVTHAPKLFG
ncbi:helix-turn-helix domain-containing protein [Halomonas alkaliantarctica]|nr:helix-turn-helix domain-containing protein [Halomonas alkaliantarctica]